MNTNSQASAAPRSFFSELLERTKWYVVTVAATVTGVVGIITFFEEHLRHYDFTQPWVTDAGAATLLLIAAGIGLPLWRERRRRAWLVTIGQSARDQRSDYFRLTPRTAADHATFRRSDGAHTKVLNWIVEAEDAPFIFLTGRSGVGKSSLLSAHVLPELRGRDPAFLVVEVRGYADPLGALTGALLKPGTVWKKPPDLTGPREVLERAARHAAPARLLVVIDQFEEFVILNDAAEQEALRSFLAELEAAPIKGAQLLFVARSDREYLAELQTLGLGRMTLGETWYVVDGFEPLEARLFLEGSGLDASEPALRALLKEGRDIDDDSTRLRPVVLNLLGMALNDLAAGTASAGRKGGLARAFLERILRGADVRDTAPGLLEHMISDAGTKRPIREAALAGETGCPQGVARGCLSLLSKEGLVREIDPATNTWEIAHDFVARMLGQILGRLRPSWSQRAMKMAGPAAVSLWIVAAFGAVPIYHEILLPAEIRKYGVSLVRIDNDWSAALTRDHAPERRASVQRNPQHEIDRVVPLLRRLGDVLELEISNQRNLMWIAPYRLEGLDALTSLTVTNNTQLGRIELPQLNALTSLVVKSNSDLRSLKIPQLGALATLSIVDNRALQTFDIPQLDSLAYLNVKANEFVLSLDIPQLNALTKLDVWHINNMESLDIPQLNALTMLRVNYNKNLRSLSIPQLDALTSLMVLENGSLASLVIPQLDALESLIVSENERLASLVIPQLDALKSLTLDWGDVARMASSFGVALPQDHEESCKRNANRISICLHADCDRPHVTC